MAISTTTTVSRRITRSSRLSQLAAGLTVARRASRTGHNLDRFTFLFGGTTATYSFNPTDSSHAHAGQRRLGSAALGTRDVIELASSGYST
jgi:hypothetical protein